jgi:hypothetical protein
MQDGLMGTASWLRAQLPLIKEVLLLCGKKVEDIVWKALNYMDQILLSFELVAGGQRWLIGGGGVYLSLNQSATDICTQLIQLCNHHPNLPFIVTGDFNIKLDAITYSIRDQEILETIEILRVSNMIKHFKQRRRLHDGAT